jgi:hypothetical protein
LKHVFAKKGWSQDVANGCEADVAKGVLGTQQFWGSRESRASKEEFKYALLKVERKVSVAGDHLAHSSTLRSMLNGRLSSDVKWARNWRDRRLGRRGMYEYGC